MISRACERAIAGTGVAAHLCMESSRRLGDILVEDYRVHREDLDAALESAEHRAGERIGTLLVRLGALSARDLVTALGQQVGCPVLLGILVRSVSPDLLELLPASLIEKKLAIPIAREGARLIVAMADPTDRITLEAIARITALDVVPAIAGEEEIRRAIKVFLHDTARDMAEISSSMESLRTRLHERTGTGSALGARVSTGAGTVETLEPDEESGVQTLDPDPSGLGDPADTAVGAGAAVVPWNPEEAGTSHAA